MKSTPLKWLEAPPTLSAKVRKLSRLLNFAGLHVVERQRVPAAARQPESCRHVVDERVEVGRRPGAVDRGLQVAPAPPDVVDFDRDPRRDLLRHAAVRSQLYSRVFHPLVVAGIDRERGDRLPEERIRQRAALAVGAPGFSRLQSATKSLVRRRSSLCWSVLTKCPSPAGL